ncbi:MAG: hypothetical protein ABXS93_01715 [Sulfurimonas sp.]
MSVLDIIMVIGFIAFMVFVFGGYHKTKFKQRENQEKKEKDS